MTNDAMGDEFRGAVVAAPESRASYNPDSVEWSVCLDPGRFHRYLRWAEIVGVAPDQVEAARNRLMRIVTGRVARKASLTAPSQMLQLDIDGTPIKFAVDGRISGQFFNRVLSRDDHGRYVVHEPEVVRALRDSLDHRTLLLDIGAHIGYFSLYAASLGAAVIAVEMQHSLCAAISANAILNGYWRVHTICAAMGGEAGISQLMRLNPQPGTQVSSEKTVVGWVPAHSLNHDLVPMLTVDQLLAMPERAGVARRVVKIDVEGAEAMVIAGARQTIADRSAEFIVELHPVPMKMFGATVADVDNAFPSRQWRRLLLEPDGEREIDDAEMLALGSVVDDEAITSNAAIRYMPR